jgi:hypothetical protein
VLSSATVCNANSFIEHREYRDVLHVAGVLLLKYLDQLEVSLKRLFSYAFRLFRLPPDQEAQDSEAF